MDNITGDLKNYEQMADNYVDSKTTSNKKKVNVSKKDVKLEKNVKDSLVKIINDFEEIEKTLSKLRELKSHKEFYDASTSLDVFKESIDKVTMIYN